MRSEWLNPCRVYIKFDVFLKKGKDMVCFMMANFVESLRVMGMGMLGIFAVAAVLIVVMKVLVILFPAKKKDE